MFKELGDRLMKSTLWILIVGAILLVAFACWPFVGFYRLATAVESRDTSALAERVDFRELGQSLAEQVVTEYGRLTGKEGKGGGIPRGIALMLAGPVIDKYLNAESLMNILTKGDTNNGSKLSLQDAPFSDSSWRDAWDVWWHSRHAVTNFYVYLPPKNTRAEQFGLRLSLRNWQWDLTRIELPDALRVRLAEEIIRREKASKG
jgi:Protein of unknown function (DUF2939)